MQLKWSNCSAASAGRIVRVYRADRGLDSVYQGLFLSLMLSVFGLAAFLVPIVLSRVSLHVAR
jgi:hypothetical protein